MDDERVELCIEPGSTRFDSNDDTWIDQVVALVDEVRAAGQPASVRRASAPGGKGPVDSIVLSVVSAGGVTSLIELIRSWLTRDRTRSMKVSWSEAGTVESIELSGADLPDDVVDKLAQAVIQHLAGGP
jgi:hypothetical protein